MGNDPITTYIHWDVRHPCGIVVENGEWPSHQLKNRDGSEIRFTTWDVENHDVTGINFLSPQLVDAGFVNH